MCKVAEKIALNQPIDENAEDLKPINMISDLEVEKREMMANGKEEVGEDKRTFKVRDQIAARIMNNSLEL